MADRPPDDLNDLDDIEEGPAEEGRILAPEELDISESEYVEELEEGRFVVSPDGPPNVDPKHTPQPDNPTSGNTNTAQTPPQHEDNPDHYTQQSEPQRTHQQSGNQRPHPTESQRSQAGAGQGGGQSAGPAPGPQQPPANQGGPQQGTQADGLTEEDVHRWLRRSFEQSTSQYAFDVTATFEGTVSQRRMASNDVVTIFESLMLWYAQQVDSNTPVEDILGILLMESNVPVRYPPESIHKLVKSSDLSPEDSIADLLAELEDGVQF